jgi:hypothetical protein
MKRNSFRFSVYKKQGEGIYVECGSSAAAFPPYARTNHDIPLILDSRAVSASKPSPRLLSLGNDIKKC